jgi:hypothetical protein
MFGHVSWLLFVIVFGAIAYAHWLLERGRPTGRSEIDNFAQRNGLRIISVVRSYNFLGYWFRRITVGDDAVRSYDLTVEDSEGNRCDFHLSFDSLSSPGQLVVLKQQGVVLTPPIRSESLTQTDSATTRLSWNEQLVLFIAGAGISGFLFCGILSTDLSPPKRPIFPEPALGYTHFLMAKHGNVYGTFFEYLAVTYGIGMMWGVAALSGLIFWSLQDSAKSPTYPRYPWQVFAAAAVSMALYFAIWQLSIYVVRS